MVVRLLHFDVIPARDATILRQQAANLALDDTHLRTLAFFAMLVQFGQRNFHSLACTFSDGMFFGFALRAAT